MDFSAVRVSQEVCRGGWGWGRRHVLGGFGFGAALSWVWVAMAQHGLNHREIIHNSGDRLNRPARVETLIFANLISRRADEAARATPNYPLEALRIMPSLTAADEAKIKAVATTYLSSKYLCPGTCVYLYESDDDNVVALLWPRSDENPARWEEIQEARIIDAEIGEVDGEYIEVEIEAELVWAFGSSSDDEGEQETQTRTFLVTVVARPDGPYVDRVEE